MPPPSNSRSGRNYTPSVINPVKKPTATVSQPKVTLPKTPAVKVTTSTVQVTTTPTQRIKRPINNVPIPNIKPVSQVKQVIIPNTTPLTNNSSIVSSNLPNITTLKEDNTITYIIIGSLILGFIILQKKDI